MKILSSLCSKIDRKVMLKEFARFEAMVTQAPEILKDHPALKAGLEILLPIFKECELTKESAEEMVRNNTKDFGIDVESVLALLKDEPAKTDSEFVADIRCLVRDFVISHETFILQTYHKIVYEGWTDKKGKHWYGVDQALRWFEQQRHYLGVDTAFGQIPTAQPHQWIVTGLLPRSGVLFFFGSGGVGKTTVVLDTLRSIYQKGHIMGFYDVDPGFMNERCLYIYGDKSAQWLSDHYLHRFPGEWLKNIDWIFPLDLKKDTIQPDELKAYIQRNKTAICVIDTFASISSIRKENDNVEVGRWMLALTSVACETGCCIIVLDHPRKRGRNKDGSFQALGADDLCGASAKNRFAAMSLIIDNKFQGQCVKDSCGKIHLGKTGIITGFPGEIHFDIETNKINYTACEMTTTERKEMSETMAKILSARPAGTDVKVAELKKSLPDISDRTLERNLSKLVETGHVAKVSRGTYKILPDEDAIGPQTISMEVLS